MSEDHTGPSPSRRGDRGHAAILVAFGILCSRIAGLLRDRVFAHFFGNSDAADAFRAAFRIPNFLQNLFGEGTLSASFIPVYSKLLARGEIEEARRVAAGVATIMVLVVSVLVAAGIAAAPYLIALIAPGFAGEKKALTIRMVQIFFPGAGLLVCSAWCLGILNSHRRFFLSYAAPVLWNLVIIAALVFYGDREEQFPLARTIAWASVAGSGAQLAAQFPYVLFLLRRFPAGLHWALSGVRTVIANFLPVFIGRGVTQISAYVDTLIASLLPTGAVAALSYAQTLYMLPVSLFGMAVSASELPALSSAVGAKEEIAGYLRGRLGNGLKRIAFFVIPSVTAFVALGDVVVAALYQTGRFTRQDVVYVWAVLAGASVGLLATTLGRLYSSTYYALGDTRTPLRYAVLRVVVAASLGYFSALYLPGLVGLEARWGIVGLAVSTGLAGWLEFSLLRLSLARRIGRTGIGRSFAGRLWLAAGSSAAAALALEWLVRGWHPVPAAVLILGVFGIGYMGAAALLLGSQATRSLLLRGTVPPAARERS